MPSSTLVEDDALLAENAGLTEWPIVLMGEFDKAFLEVPAECLMILHEDAPEVLLAAASGKKLANKFLLVSNLNGQGRRRGRSSPATRR